ncbi:ABC transporter ATP-binding protein [Niveispirillum sp. KHB5.9]|uniref:ABC transporter ATP-binding protein n=1 Tax=Niveispirillum sp. KHB5.9 TaxID=3400269 RepID=UPI003A87378F
MATTKPFLAASPLLRLLAIYREMPVRFTATALLYAIVNGSMAWQQWLIGHAVDEVRNGQVVKLLPDGGLDFDRAWFWLAALIGLATLRSAIQYGAGVLALIIGQELLTLIRERILSQVQRLDLTYHWRHGIGELITRTTRDSDKVRDALVGFWRQVVETGMVLVSSVAILFWYAPTLGIVPLLAMLTGLTVLMRQADRLVALDRVVGEAYDAVNQDLSEGINGVRVVKAFGLEETRIGRFQAQVTRFTDAARDAIAYATRNIPLPQTIVAISHVWVLGYGALLVGTDQLTVGGLVASLLAANTLVLRVEGIGTVIQTFADARASAGRIWDLLDEEPAIKPGDRTLAAGLLGIRLERVRLAAPGGGRDILRDLSLRADPGEIVAIVGNTGSGKSAILSLLPRLADIDGGSILVGSDTRGWADIRVLETGSLRRHVHVVPQESFLFSDSLAANLRFAKPEASDEDLHHALALAAGEEILDHLPDGFDTRLGDRGVTLSGGQRQRLCLARALLSGASILALDDATSALDAATERRVLENIRGLRDVTLLVVSSKLSTILMADRVLLLADGRIAASGTHEELAATNQAYRDLMGI